MATGLKFDSKFWLKLEASIDEPSYSLDLRERVVSAMTSGMSRQQAAHPFSIGESSALRWARRARETGSATAKLMGGTRPFALEAHCRWITAR